MNIFLKKIANAFHDRLWRAPRGLGRPIAASAWDINFASGNWEYLSNLSETSRYAIIHNYAVRLISPARILDIGCGAGVLRSFFDEDEFVSYVGLDLSGEAIRLSKSRNFPSTSFLVVDFDEYVLDTAHDIIIFNESIGYAADPGKTFKRYWDTLPQGKIVIISTHDYDIRSRASWKRIERHAKPQYSSKLINEQGQIWDVRVFIKEPSSCSGEINCENS